jgi:hypothetical protein
MQHQFDVRRNFEKGTRRSCTMAGVHLQREPTLERVRQRRTTKAQAAARILLKAAP